MSREEMIEQLLENYSRTLEDLPDGALLPDLEKRCDEHIATRLDDYEQELSELSADDLLGEVIVEQMRNDAIEKLLEEYGGDLEGMSDEQLAHHLKS